MAGEGMTLGRQHYNAIEKWKDDLNPCNLKGD
jgi:hypothetical protein